jgi:hypothetical protein
VSGGKKFRDFEPEYFSQGNVYYELYAYITRVF